MAPTNSRSCGDIKLHSSIMKLWDEATVVWTSIQDEAAPGDILPHRASYWLRLCLSQFSLIGNWLTFVSLSHINKLSARCFYHLSRFRSVRRKQLLLVRLIIFVTPIALDVYCLKHNVSTDGTPILDCNHGKKSKRSVHQNREAAFDGYARYETGMTGKR